MVDCGDLVHQADIGEFLLIINLEVHGFVLELCLLLVYVALIVKTKLADDPE